MSKLNHMANKFDLFLKDTDLNKKFLLWNKLNFTTKEVGEVRKQFFPHLFFSITTAVAQSVPGWRSFQLFFSVWNMFPLENSPSYRQMRAAALSCARQSIKSDPGLKIFVQLPVSTQRFCHLKSYFLWACWREKCHSLEQLLQIRAPQQGGGMTRRTLWISEG